MIDTPNYYYAILGLEPTATPEQIKQAYRVQAKRNHPDAGGSLEAMQLINQAHQVLGDAASRQEYDRLRDALAHPPESSAPPAEHQAYDAKEEQIKRELHHRMRLAQARANAWRIIKNSASLALLTNIITRFVVSQTTDNGQKIIFSLLGFLPVYALLIGCIFWLSPALRLDFHDIAMKSRRPTRADKLVFSGIGVAFIPLAALWVVLFGSL